MKHTTSFFQCSDDVQLFSQVWRPDEEPMAALVIVHGFSDHCNRYTHMVNGLVPRGFVIYSYDQIGHGQSPGNRGHVDQFSDFRDDLHEIINHVARQEPGLPLYLFGHSMGGLIVLDYGLFYPAGMDGVIASAPLLSEPPISPILKGLTKLLSGILPSISIDAGLDSNTLSRDEAVVKDYIEDPLVHGKGSPRFATEISAAVDNTQANAADFKPPLLIYHGTADTLTDPKASKRFFDNVESSNKIYIAHEGGFHEGHNDLHKEQVINDISQWMIEQMERGEEVESDSADQPN